MFQLILHHNYLNVPQAIDVSGGDNHGVVSNVGYSKNGRSSNSGALDFNKPSSRVSVQFRPAFQHLFALKIEATVRLRGYNGRHNLVEGDNSFAFFIQPDGTLWGTALGHTSTNGSLGWYGAQTLPTAVSRIVPLNQWVKVTYLHDGFATIRLYINDNLVAANYSLHSPIRPVGYRGVSIGNWPAGNSYPFNGEIDEIKIWRWEPDAAYYNFFCRKTTRCWRKVFDAIGHWAREYENREKYRTLLFCIGNAQAELIREVRSKGEEAIYTIQKFSDKYKALWCKGEIAGEDMQLMIEEWLRWLKELLGREKLMSYLQRITSCYERSEINLNVNVVKCDPEFKGYIELLMKAANN